MIIIINDDPDVDDDKGGLKLLAPCDIIVVTASSHHNCLSVWYSTCTIPNVFKLECSSTWGKLLKSFKITWHSLCSEMCCNATAAKQDDGVGKRRRRPSRVIISRLAVIVFDKDDDCDRLLFFEFDTC